jgi:hypothetical protein
MLQAIPFDRRKIVHLKCHWESWMIKLPKCLQKFNIHTHIVLQLCKVKNLQIVPDPDVASKSRGGFGETRLYSLSNTRFLITSE